MSDESIVLQLQRDALNREVPVSDLLRKALLVATKLGVHDLEEWINHELNGYPDSRTFPFPPYRQLEGQLVAYNPVQRRWMPVVSNDPRFIEGLSIRPSNQRVAELEHVLAADTDGVLRMLSPAAVQARIQRGMEFPAQVELHVSAASVAGILDEVRTVILRWAMTLEKSGILGEGMSFTPKEQEAAAKTPAANINYFFGAVHHAQVQQGAEDSSQVIQTTVDLDALRALVAELKKHAATLPLSPAEQSELQAEVGTLESQLQSSKPKTSIIRESLSSVRHILEGAGAKVAADWLARVLAGLQQTNI